MDNATYNLSKQRQRDTHYQVMRILQKNLELTWCALFLKLGLSLSKLNYYLKALAKKGWNKYENFTQSKTKHRYFYLLTPQGFTKKLI